MDKLNVGCGTDYKEGWINLDVVSLPTVDVVHDVNKTPYPFEDEQFKYILCKDVLEHVDYINVLKELHRILKQGGEIHIQVPHFSSINNYIDPTHINRYSVDTFSYFIHSHLRNYYFDFGFSAVKDKRISFVHLNKIIEPLVNLSHFCRKLYERTGLAYIFPAHNINVTLIK